MSEAVAVGPTLAERVAVVREVPWVGVTGTDTGSYQPAFDPEGVDESVDEQLEALGYK